MADIDINRIQKNIEELQDQNAIDFQQWKRLGQEIEKLTEKIKTSDRNSWPVVLDSKEEIVWLPGLKKSNLDKKNTEEYDIILRYY